MAINDFVAAANGGVPGNTLKPQNCHEAVLGSLFMSRAAYLTNNLDTNSWPGHWKSPQPAPGQIASWAWATVRELATRYGVHQGAGGVGKQLDGLWFGQKLYNGGLQLMLPPGGAQFPAQTVFAGDVIYMGIPQRPHHSMVVVQDNNPAPAPLGNANEVARGFNNPGAFGLSAGPFGPGAPPMAWDPALRNILDVAHWNANNEFVAVNGAAQIHRIDYAQVSARLPMGEVWGHVHFPVR